MYTVRKKKSSPFGNEIEFRGCKQSFAMVMVTHMTAIHTSSSVRKRMKLREKNNKRLKSICVSEWTGVGQNWPITNRVNIWMVVAFICCYMAQEE